ncbi:MAG: 16S rRNA (cytidine(1402)-2'-O)-methyltransferase, partial [Clostridia bacterium]|nr:16S rRNA (cytidine(1402)-2'-O)-methyltransferase [Clostridia bacterium]
LAEALDDMLDILGDRKISICRELTKINEETVLTTLKDAVAYYASNEPRGEYVLVVEGAKEESAAFFADMSIADHVAHYEKQGMSLSDAMKACAKDRGVSKRDVYAAVMKK